MMLFIADLHIHSKYSRATAKDMDIPNLAKWAKIKGISMLGTGDFTHPSWISELEKKLEEAGPGVYMYEGVSFILSAEVSNIYAKAGRTRKVHNIIFAPSFRVAKEINNVLSQYGKLSSDGRPILKLECDKMARMLTGIGKGIFIVPAHAWTPHFSIFGSRSGFDSIEECFEDQAPNIFSIETGLSSDPAMNWRWSKLDSISLISNSDAHSPSKIGREANVFKEKIGYDELFDILKKKDRSRFLHTIEFFPEEGKYHWDGHRKCKTRLSPEEAISANNTCPVCKKKITLGVAHRMETLCDRKRGYVDPKSPPYKSLVPLCEIISEAMDVGPNSKAVEKEYLKMIKDFGTEFKILIEAPREELKEKCPEKIVQGIINVRNGNLDIVPGYDGEYGRVSVY